jgi:hypothetical protein
MCLGKASGADGENYHRSDGSECYVGRCFVHRDGVIVHGILLNRDGPRHVGLHLGDLPVAQGVSIRVPAREFCELGPRSRGETLGPRELGVAGMSIPAR